MMTAFLSELRFAKLIIPAIMQLKAPTKAAHAIDIQIQSAACAAAYVNLSSNSVVVKQNTSTVSYLSQLFNQFYSPAFLRASLGCYSVT